MADANIPFPKHMTVVITAGAHEPLFDRLFDKHLRACKAVVYLVDKLGCSPVPEVAYWPDPKARGIYWPARGEKTAVVRYVYTAATGAKVVYFKIIRGGQRLAGWDTVLSAEQHWLDDASRRCLERLPLAIPQQGLVTLKH